MTLTFIGLIIAVAALIAYFVAAGRRGWILFVVALLCAIAGFSSSELMAQGSQTLFARLPITVTQQAWLLNLLGFVGVGALAGTITRGALALVSSRSQQKPVESAAAEDSHN